MHVKRTIRPLATRTPEHPAQCTPAHHAVGTGDRGLARG